MRTLFFAVGVAFVSSAGASTANAAQPGSRFDLSHWKLTLPTDASNQYSGQAKEISASQLTAGFQDPHFQTDANGDLVFWCPVYFKASAYPQDNDGPASEGSRVAFFVLNVGHPGKQ